MRPENTGKMFALGLILLIGAVIYSNTLHAPFYFDDYPNILLNPRILNLGDWIDLLSYIPTRFLSYLSFAINYAFGGTSPLGYHLVNIAIHCLNSFWIFLIAHLLLSAPSVVKTPSFPVSRNLIALSAAMLFLCHPLQTQAVTYIVQRMTSLASFFYLGTLGLYLDFRMTSRRTSGLLGLLTAFLGMLTKEIMFTLPLTLLLCEICFFQAAKGKSTAWLKRWIPFAIVALVIPVLFYLNHESIIRQGGQMNLIPNLATHISRYTYSITQLDVIRTYLRLLFFPVQQTFDYDFTLSSGLFTLTTFPSLLLVLAILGIAVCLLRKQPLISFGILFFFLNILIPWSMIPVPDLIVEHRLYLPMAGFALCAAAGLARSLRSPRVFRIVLILLVTILGTLTYLRNAVWADEIVFWKDQTQKAPFKGRGYFHLAEAYSKNHEFLPASDSLLHALQRTPAEEKRDIYFNNLGSVSTRLVPGSRTSYWYRKGLEIYPRSGILYTGLAVLEIHQGNLDHAMTLLKKAITVAPETPIAYYELAHVHMLKGEYPEAISWLQKAIALDRLLRPAYELLFKLYRLQGKKPAAVEALKKAAEIYPPSPALYVQLGEAYEDIDRDREAESAFQKAIAAAPLSREGYDALAYFYFKKNDRPRAIEIILKFLKESKQEKKSR